MKRKLALFMVLALVVSLLPMNVFAASDNGVNKVPTVADDHEFDEDDAPMLKIEEDDDEEFEGESQTFVLKLDNAEWDEDDVDLIQDNFDSNDDSAELYAQYISSTRMQIELLVDDATARWVKIPLVAELQGEGAAKVIIEDKGSAVSSDTITFAYGSGGDTSVTIDDTVDFRDTVEIENIVIEENVIDTFDNDSTEINLKILDNDMSWEEAGTVSFTGGFDVVDHDVDADDVDDNVLTITVANIYGGGAGSTLGTITFDGLEIDPGDANYGEVKVKVYGDDVTTETITVGDFIDYAVTVEADDDEEDLPVLFTGDLNEDYEDMVADAADLEAEDADVDDVDGEENELSPLVFEETVAESWIINRETKVEFEDWVKIIDVDVTDSTNVVDSEGNDVDDADMDYDIGDSEFSFDNLEADVTTDTMDLELTIYVSVEADHGDDDIIATVSGKSLDQDYEVKLATVVAPLTFEVEVADVVIGVQDQPTGNIVVTEYEEEVLEDEEEVTATLDADDGMEWAATPDAEVTKGDLTIDDVEKDEEIVTVIIDNESTEVSTFEISGFEVDADRTVPEGAFNITLGGSLIKNYEEDGEAFFFDTDNFVDVQYVRIITPADKDVQAAETVAFTIDAMEYKIGETVVTMDVAPYIDSANRTMLPLRAFANALGVADTDILWNGTERSVTIFKGDAVVKVVIGQMSFMKNGVSVPMDTMAVIKDGRTFLPVRALGQALGGQIGWDAATRTVTID